MTVRPSKTQIRPVWSESSLCALCVAKDPSFLHADSEDSDQTGRMPRLIWVFAGRTCHFVVFVMRRLILCCKWTRRPIRMTVRIASTITENCSSWFIGSGRIASAELICMAISKLRHEKNCILPYTSAQCDQRLCCSLSNYYNGWTTFRLNRFRLIDNSTTLAKSKISRL